MLYDNYTEKLTGLKDAIVTEVKEFNLSKHIYITLKRKIQICPKCGAETDKVHDYREQTVKDVSAFGLMTYLHLRKRRYVCTICRKRFQEKNTFLPKYQRTTNRLWANVISSLGDVKSMKQVAKENNISCTSVARIFDNVGTANISRLPSVIGIDEFKGNSGGEKFNCILTNPAKHQILDIMPKRKSEDLFEYFSAYPNRKDVRIVTMDMSTLFRSVAISAFPNAEIVADKYHVVRQVTWAFENVRKRIQKSLSEEGRVKLKGSRRLLLKRKADLTAEEMHSVATYLYYSKDLGAAYYLKEKFYEFMDSENETEAREKLKEWFIHANAANLDEFKKCMDTFLNWENEILNAFRYNLTNGYTEGCNNLIKVIKRTGYGLVNFERFRKRILYITSKTS